MKTLRYFFFIALASLLMASDCSNDDTEFYNDVFIDVPNLVEIETQSAYVVGDVVQINTNAMGRYVDEINESNRLDLYRSSGGAKSYSFTYILEKKNSNGEWGIVNPQNLLVREKGIAVGTDFVFAKSVYNASTERYEFRNGIRLEETGEYRLSFGYNSASINSVELRSDSQGNELYVNINSFNSAIDSTGYYYFLVN